MQETRNEFSQQVVANEQIRSPFVGRARAKHKEDEARRDQERYIREQFMEYFGRLPTHEDIWEPGLNKQEE